jgi:predicted enzyme related to lactoylglutathione lyase
MSEEDPFLKKMKLRRSGNGQRSGGMMTRDSASPKSSWNFYFDVDSADAAMKRVLDAGGKITTPSHEVPGGGWIVFAVDPQGASFSMFAPIK